MAKRRCIVSLLMVLTVCIALMFAACNDSPKETVSGDEVGTYYNDSFGSEYLITLKEKGAVDFNVDDVSATGTYTLDGTELSISLTGEEETISATFQDRTISLTYNEKQMVFLEKITYTVTFNTNGGSAIAPKQVLNGKRVEKPDDPTRTNYKFLNWYQENTYKTLFDFEKEITENTTAYAKWEYIPIQNTLTYDNTEATTEKPSASVTESEGYTLEVPKNRDSESTDVFVGWFTAKDGKGEQLTDGTGASLDVWDARGNITIYPYFAPPFTYTLLDNDTYSVSGSSESVSFSELVVPAYYKNKAVTAIGSFENHRSLVRVSIPATVTTVLSTAFNDSPLIEEYIVSDVDGVTPVFEAVDGILYSDERSVLVKYPIARKVNGAPETSFTVPAYVTKIAPYAFADILAKSNGDYEPGEYYGTLTEIILPAGLTEVGDHAFFERQELTKITFSDSPVAKELTIGEYAFAYTKTTTGLTLPYNLVEIKTGAFTGNSNFVYAGVLTGEGELVLPAGLKTIGDKAFEYNGWITEITFPSSVTSIGANAFANCGSYYGPGYESFGGLAKIAFPTDSQLTSISDGAFSWGTKLVDVTLPTSLRYLGASVFSGCSVLTMVELPEGILTIGDSLFEGCRSLTSANIPSTVTSLGSGVFGGCTKLTLDNIEIPNDSLVLSKDGQAIFNRDRTSLILYPVSNEATSYTIPSTVTKIEPYAFQNNAFLESVTFPEGLTDIGEGAFSECVKLKSVVLPEGITVINPKTFEGCDDLASVHIPASVTEIGESAFGGKTWTVTIQLVVTFAPGSQLTAIGDNAFDGCNIASIELPDSLISIGNEAFSGNDFESIVIPDSVQILGDYAFGSCLNLKSAVMPKNLASVGMAPFWGSDSLEEMKIAADAPNFKVIDGHLYSADGTVLVQYAYGKPDASFRIPEEVTTINAYSMSGSEALTEVHITENVANVGIMVWHSGNVETYIIDSQSFINLFDDGYPTDMGYEVKTVYVRDDIEIPSTATYFSKYYERQETSDKDGYIQFVKK